MRRDIQILLFSSVLGLTATVTSRKALAQVSCGSSGSPVAGTCFSGFSDGAFIAADIEQSGTDSAIFAKNTSTSNPTVVAVSSSFVAVQGSSNDTTLPPSLEIGVLGQTNSSTGAGVLGANHSTSGGAGVAGESSGGGYGVQGIGSGTAIGVYGQSSSSSSYGVYGINNATGTAGSNGEGSGVFGTTSAYGGTAVYGVASGSTYANGVAGVSGSSSASGVFGSNTNGGWAGYFSGKVNVTGALTVGSCSGCGSDIRLKKSVKQLGRDAIDQLLQLKGVTFEWKDSIGSASSHKAPSARTRPASRPLIPLERRYDSLLAARDP